MKLNLQQLDLNLLLVFDALMRERNLSRAAIRLHRSQPAVSNALARLREQLDQPLFRRTAKGLEPTAAALALYVPVRQALHLLQAGLGSQEAFDPHTARSFRLTMNDYAQLRLLPGLVTRLKTLAPRVTLEVRPDEGASIPAQLASGELDLAIDYLYFDEPELAYRPVGEERLVVIGLPGNPASTLVTFALLARPYLLRRLGVAQVAPLRVEVPAGFAWTKAGQRREYLRGRLKQGRAVLYPNQSSGVLRSASWAEGLVEVREGRTLVEGEGVAFIPLSELLD